jgi:hypothetical protein
MDAILIGPKEPAGPKPLMGEICPVVNLFTFENPNALRVERWLAICRCIWKFSDADVRGVPEIEQPAKGSVMQPTVTSIRVNRNAAAKENTKNHIPS